MYLASALVQPSSADHVPTMGKTALDWVPFKALCPEGVWGHPRQATAAKGQLAMSAAVRNTVTYIQESFAYLEEAKQSLRDKYSA
jgi:creatinine amidohydrolase/Fe(II)-dependent formamide hydrolase-like protein